MFGAEVPIEYDTRDLTLEPGDVLLLASDGLGEIQPGEEEQFQDKAQRAAFAELAGRDGHEVILGLVERAREFNGSDRYDDDLTLQNVSQVARVINAVAVFRGIGLGIVEVALEESGVGRDAADLTNGLGVVADLAVGTELRRCAFLAALAQDLHVQIGNLADAAAWIPRAAEAIHLVKKR